MARVVLVKLNIEGKEVLLDRHSSALYRKILKDRGPEVLERLVNIRFGLFDKLKKKEEEVFKLE